MAKKRVSAASQALQKMRALIERGWAQGTFAADAHGERVSQFSNYATCFCLLGAYHRVRKQEKLSARTSDKIFELITSRVKNMVTWNDSAERTQTQVLSMLDEVIASA